MTKCLINDEPFNWEQSRYVYIIHFFHKSVTEILPFYHFQVSEANHVTENNGVEKVLGNVTIGLNR